MFIITLLLLIYASMITSEQLNRRTIVDLPLTGLNETNKEDLNAYDVKSYLSKHSQSPFSHTFTIQLKHNHNPKMNDKKEKKKEKLYEFKYEKACICKDWKCDWRRSGDIFKRGIEDISKLNYNRKHCELSIEKKISSVSGVIDFLRSLHKYNNQLREGKKKIKLQKNCVCLRKVCPTRSGDFEEVIVQDVSEDLSNF